MIPSPTKNLLISIPYTRLRCLKTIPFAVAHTYITHILWFIPKPPPPPPNRWGKLTQTEVTRPQAATIA